MMFPPLVQSLIGSDGRVFFALRLLARKRYGARLFGRAGLFWAVLSKAAAHGKRLRLVAAAWTNQ
jgi:hypothetical protein